MPADVVVPVPDSGVPAALGYAQESGVPFEMGIIRNHYAGRTFIQPTQGARELGVRMKLCPNRSVLAGKRVMLIDDFIVRGTTSVRVVRMVREAGAAEVHLRSPRRRSSGPTSTASTCPTATSCWPPAVRCRRWRACWRWTASASSRWRASTGRWGRAARSRRPQFTDHYFTGDYPTRLLDRELAEGRNEAVERQLSFLVDCLGELPTQGSHRAGHRRDARHRPGERDGACGGGRAGDRGRTHRKARWRRWTTRSAPSARAGDPAPIDLSDTAMASTSSASRSTSATAGSTSWSMPPACSASSRPVAHVPPDLWARIVATNLTSAFGLIRSLEPLLRASDGSRAIFLTSGAAANPKAFWGAYAATKAGLEALVRSWADEVESSTIRAILLNPGPMRTAMRAEAYPGEDKAILPPPGGDRTPDRRAGEAAPILGLPTPAVVQLQRLAVRCSRRFA